jgi:hypothetical protein
VDFIKADVEGWEMAILEGAADTIRMFQPRMALTVYHQGNDWRQMVRFARRLAPECRYRVKGMSLATNPPQPVMLHLWVDS